MKISLATNFENDLIDSIKNYPVYELYGKLKSDLIGGGRPNNTLKEREKDEFESHVKKTIDAGIKFNYLLNGSCLSNNEQSEKWKYELKNFLDYLKSIGVNAITVTNPFILQFIKKYYSCFTVRVSTFACIDNFEKAKYWEEMGADYICADFVKINRDFETLSYMVNNLKHAKIEILVTNSCIKNCPYIYTHTNSLAHASNRLDNGDKYADWCLFCCQSKQLNSPKEYIKSCWVRPEDLKYYEDIGIEHFKITERDFPTSELLKRVRAYTKRRFDGNLLDLIQGHGYSSGNIKNQIKRKTNFEDKNQILKEICKVRGLGCVRNYERHMYIDNRKLDGFLDFFVNKKCGNNCNNCKYCESVSDKVITENKEISDYLRFLYKAYDELKF